jgi:hypothetical protein
MCQIRRVTEALAKLEPWIEIPDLKRSLSEEFFLTDGGKQELSVSGSTSAQINSRTIQKVADSSPSSMIPAKKKRRRGLVRSMCFEQLDSLLLRREK